MFAQGPGKNADDDSTSHFIGIPFGHVMNAAILPEGVHYLGKGVIHHERQT
jgi:hypothetical protein